METSTQPSPQAVDLLDAVGPAFSRLRRAQALNVEKQVSRKDITRTLVLNIVQDGPDAEGQEITVGVVGERLAVDPSVASRMVSDCITAGYLIRAASQRDGRRTILQLTPEGHETLARFRRHQRAAFERITQDWPEQERLEFARLLIKYVDSVGELQQDPGSA
ncbi:MarR family winged helix-turn-helix transcriptional regulator [Streptomyces fulvoviolaceus]|uniref:MarR family winged helix-turn-helix transcriptional regulator n=1 Tax=Streptomyces fulvoviolaceus TaxID=285535 RepID=UPI0004CAEB99|nr:MarR family winged helix-turn-helix transcriptional regulator [Streptomyces fulvoviolaceus]MCT9079669.1 MarR family winged helix-turn-helix transcriptional regulator [Streptomyces fulvoviolaceus]